MNICTDQKQLCVVDRAPCGGQISVPSCEGAPPEMSAPQCDLPCPLGARRFGKARRFPPEAAASAGTVLVGLCERSQFHPETQRPPVPELGNILNFKCCLFGEKKILSQTQCKQLDFDNFCSKVKTFCNKLRYKRNLTGVGAKISAHILFLTLYLTKIKKPRTRERREIRFFWLGGLKSRIKPENFSTSLWVLLSLFKL